MTDNNVYRHKTCYFHFKVKKSLTHLLLCAPRPTCLPISPKCGQKSTPSNFYPKSGPVQICNVKSSMQHIHVICRFHCHTCILSCPVSAWKNFFDCPMWPFGAYVSKKEPHFFLFILEGFSPPLNTGYFFNWHFWNANNSVNSTDI